jgi:hypothetical protein
MKGYKKNHNEYCVLCGVPQTNHLMVNHLFYSNLEYKDVTDDRSFCKICGQKKETHTELLHSFQTVSTKIEKNRQSINVCYHIF